MSDFANQSIRARVFKGARLTALSAGFIAWLAHCSYADDPKKTDKKSEPTKPAAAPKTTPAAGGENKQKKHEMNSPTLEHLKKLDRQAPDKGNNSTTPKEQGSGRARQGWDTRLHDKPLVKGDDATKHDPIRVAQTAEEQRKKEERARAQKYPAIGKEPPAPPPEKSDNQKRGLSRWFGGR